MEAVVGHAADAAEPCSGAHGLLRNMLASKQRWMAFAPKRALRYVSTVVYLNAQRYTHIHSHQPSHQTVDTVYRSVHVTRCEYCKYV